MSQQRPKPLEMDFLCSSEPVAEINPRRHHEGLVRRLSCWREEQLALRALRIAGDPSLVLNLPCGTGHFWPALTRHANRLVLVADSSTERLMAAQSSQPAEIAQRIRVFQSSASAIDLGENAVDSILCMHLLSQLDSSNHRLAVLREFYRVTRDTLIVSLWVDGNYQAWKRKRLERRGAIENRASARCDRVVLSRSQIEAEFRSVGFHSLTHLDLLPGCAMWRIYVLRKES